MKREMTCYLRDATTDKFLRKEKRIPECGEDFCDTCGDCLACYGDDPCYPDEYHLWIKYIGNED